MLLGALVDAGLSLDILQTELGKLPLGGYTLSTERQVRRGVSGTKLRVTVDQSTNQPHRDLRAIRALIQESTLAPQVVARAIAVFERLARAEAKVHGIPLDEVHFHEIGAVDSIVDVVGFVVGLHRLGVNTVYASTLPTGSGMVETAHGPLPIPAPATLEILAEVGAPIQFTPVETELLTPTGAALLAEFATFDQPSMSVHRVGYGFGDRELPWTNAVRVVLGEPLLEIAERDEVVLLECNLDDTTGQVLGYTMERCLVAGALDVWFTPIQMKKNRPGILLSALATPERVGAVAEIILQETTTLGLRQTRLQRHVAWRTSDQTVETPWGPVRIKVKYLAGQPVSASPEYEDCARLARESGEPLMRVYEAAMEAGRALL